MQLCFDKENSEIFILKVKSMICDKKCEILQKSWSLLILFYRKYLNLQTKLYKIT